MPTEALAFDMYGTLVDPLRIWQQLEGELGDAAPRAAEVWRAKQLEYTFRLTAMQRYEDFELVTRKSLEYSLVALGCTMPREQLSSFVAAYDRLEAFADVALGLERLHAAGHAMAVLSNGTPRMLASVAESTGLANWFTALISVD